MEKKIMKGKKMIRNEAPLMPAQQPFGGGKKKRGSSVNTFKVPVVGTMSFGSSWDRRLQTMASFSCSMYCFFILSLVCTYWTGLCLLFPLTTVPMILYLSCIFLGLDGSPVTGSRVPFLRHNVFTWWWSNACDYFPITLVKTANLDPEKSYVLGYHPHGIISVGALGAFGTNGARTLSLVNDKDDDSSHYNHQYYGEDCRRGFSSLFPGIDRRMITLPINFQTPFLREYVLSMGCCNSSRNTFRNVLSRNNGKGNAVVVVVGGAAESMIVHRGAIDLVLDKRKGFVREAIISNASLVPVLAFGETDLYHVTHLEEDSIDVSDSSIRSDENKKSNDKTTNDKDTDNSESEKNNSKKDHSIILNFQSWVKATTGVAVPLFRGRSIFFKDFGFMPLRKPVVVVVGKPIDPPRRPSGENFSPKIDYDTNSPINDDGKILMELHSQYVHALKELYQKCKDSNWNQPGQQRQGTLTIVE